MEPVIFLVDNRVDPLSLLQIDFAVEIRIVDGGYRIEKLPDQGEKKDSVP